MPSNSVVEFSMFSESHNFSCSSKSFDVIYVVEYEVLHFIFFIPFKCFFSRKTNKNKKNENENSASMLPQIYSSFYIRFLYSPKVKWKEQKSWRVTVCQTWHGELKSVWCTTGAFCKINRIIPGFFFLFFYLNKLKKRRINNIG